MSESDYVPLPVFENVAGTIPEEKPEIAWLPVDDLVINPAYQRDISRRGFGTIKKIAVDFHWARFGIVTVCRLSDGRYSVLDGQHRCAALKSIDPSLSVPCLIIPEMDAATQAQHFIGLNIARSALTPAAQFKARLVAGDRQAKQVFDFIQDECGIRPLLYSGSSLNQKSHWTNAFKQIEKIWSDSLRRGRLKRALTLMTQAQNKNIGGRQLKSLFNFLGTDLSDGVSDQEIVIVLDRFGGLTLEGQIRDHRRNTGDSVIDAAAVIFWRHIMNLRDAERCA